MPYKAFISYSHAADGRLAPALQSALQRFTKRWYQLRALSVFRDSTDLSLSPDLWTSIEESLAQSEYFILFASPDSATSQWVGKEIDFWLRNRSARTMLIVLTEGELAWDHATGDFDREVSTAVPASLHGVFTAEPLYLDMRWARRAEDLTLRDLEFRDGVASLAATLHGRPKSELVGEDVRQQRRTRRLAWSAVTTVSLLALAATIAAVVAVQQRQEAERQTEIALARQLAAQAELMRARQASLLPRSVLLAIESMNTYRSEEADQALRNGLALLPRPLPGIAHRLGVVAAELSRDGRLATADSRGFIRLWDVASGDMLTEMRHEGGVSALAFGPEALLLASAGGDGSARIWNAEGGEVARLEEGQPVGDLVFTPDGRHLITATSAGPAGVWAEWRESPRKVGTIPDNYSRALAISADGHSLAMVGRSYDAVQVLEGLNLESVAGSGGVPRPVEDDRSLVPSGLRAPGRGRASRGGATAPPITRLPAARVPSSGLASSRLAVQPTAGAVVSHDGNVRAVDFSPDRRLLATASDDGTARIWEAGTGRELLRLRHENVVTDVAFSPDGLRLATASADRAARLWDATTGQELLRMTHGRQVNTVCFSADGRLLATASADHSVGLWQLVGGGEARWSLNQPVESVAFSPDGRYLVAASWSGRVWDVAAAEEVGEAKHGNRVHAVAFSPDGRHLLTAGASSGGAARLWQAPAGGAVVAFGRGSAGSVAFSPDSALVAIGSKSGGQVVSVPSGEPAYDLPEVSGVAFSPDGSLLATAGSEGVHLREVASGAEIALLAHPEGASAVSFGPDGSLLATGSADGAARLWEIEGRREIAAFNHQNGINAIALSPDGGYLATAARDNTASVWDLATRRRVAQLTYKGSDQSLSSLAFSPDGRYLATGGGRRDAANNTVRLWLWRPDDLIAEACARLTRNLTREEWRQDLGSRQYRKTCPGLPADAETAR